MKNDVFYLKYLPEEPAAVATVGKGDIIVDSLTIGHTNSDNLVTKMVCEWTTSGAQEDPYKTILRHNVAKYGTHEETFDYYIYNYPGAVIKSATFWTIRRSNTWKKVRFSTPLTKLNLESLDDISVNLVGDLANVAVTCSIETAEYNSADRTLEFECWTPVKAGTMTPYIFAYPADVDQFATFPTVEEIQNGYNGSGFDENKSATGLLLTQIEQKAPFVFKGFTLEVPCTKKGDPFGWVGAPDCDDDEEEDDTKNDEGKDNPSDLGDIKPEFVDPDSDILTDDNQGPQSIEYPGIPIPEPGDFANANYSGQSGGDGTGGSGGDESDLPDPDDIEDDACNWTVVSGQLAPVSSVRPGGCTSFDISAESGASGCVVNGHYIANVYVFVYNSRSAAEAKAIEINTNKFGTVGENLIWSAHIVPGLVSCEEPADPQQLAYRGP